MQLYEQIRNDIINSIYKYGDKLPSKRILAEETLTSVITVEHAYGILCDEGYIEQGQRGRLGSQQGVLTELERAG